MTLEQTIVDKAPGVLPEILGDSLPEQLWNGRQAAVAAVERYAGKLVFDSIAAEAVTMDIREWMDRNREPLEDVLGGPIDPDAAMPPSLQLVLERSQLRQWIIAQLTLASEGLGPWMSGRLAAEVEDPSSVIDDSWARDDADMRLQIFAMILRMDDTGELQRIFAEEPATDSAREMIAGAPVPWGWIVLALLGAILIVSLAVVYSDQLQARTAVQRDLCLRAQQEGDAQTVRWCLEAMEQADPTRQLAGQLGKVVMVLGGGFLLVRFGLPFILDLIDERKGGH